MNPERSVRKLGTKGTLFAGFTLLGLAAFSGAYAKGETVVAEAPFGSDYPTMSDQLVYLDPYEVEAQPVTAELLPRRTLEIINQTTNYWIYAHPDDETLASAAAMMQSEEDGNRNVVVIISSGENTAVGPRLRLSKQQTSEAREKESRAALSNIDLEDIRYLKIPEGQITRELVREVIRSLISETNGKAVFRGHSPYDSYLGLPCGHVDHCVIGNALVDAWKEGEIGDLKLYRIGHLFNGPKGEVCRALTPAQLALKQKMKKEYALVNRSQGRYGIAAQSVPGAWYQADRQPECFDLPK